MSPACCRWSSFLPKLFLATLITAGLFGGGCESIAEGDEAASGADGPVPLWSVAQARAASAQDGGHFSLLTYNVAGLPQAISPSNPHVNTPLISPLLNDYDVVLVQEDFIYHDALVSAVAHPHRSAPLREQPSLLDIGDGLNLLSRLPLESGVQREAWQECSGTFSHAWDCRARKGFSAARMQLGPGGPSVTVINLHMDAGSSEADRSVRRVQVEQLLAWLEANAEPHEPLILAGDTNLNTANPYDLETYQSLLEATGLSDACELAQRRTTRVPTCDGPRRIDKVLFRGGREVELEVFGWREPEHFVDGSQRDLSDHLPVAVEFGWSRPRLAER